MLKVNSKQKAQYKKKPSTRSAFKNSRTNETNASTNSVGNQQDEPQSEILKVISVKKKKQRINDNYLGVEDADGLDSEYGEYDDEYDAEEAEMQIEDLTGLSQNLLRLIVQPMNLEEREND